MTYISDLLGTYTTLEVRSVDEHGAHLCLSTDGVEGDEVLLPGSEFGGADPVKGDTLKVFIYKDSEDRLVATLCKPLITLHQVSSLEVIDVTSIGAFLQMGLMKDLFLPFKEQTRRVRVGDEVYVALYIDKSERLAATMHLYEYLRTDTDSLFQKNDHVHGQIYDILDSFGAYVIVDGGYSALIPKQHMTRVLSVGDEVDARIVDITDDGKLTLTLSEKKKVQMRDDAEKIYERLREEGGVMYYSDRTAPEIIKREFSMSKAAFKRALGRLKKQGKINIESDHISDRNT